RPEIWDTVSEENLLVQSAPPQFHIVYFPFLIPQTVSGYPQPMFGYPQPMFNIPQPMFGIPQTVSDNAQTEPVSSEQTEPVSSEQTEPLSSELTVSGNRQTMIEFGYSIR
ncbi:MAG: hypothetical protein EZS28_044082, partial [Streblomastix strix]